MASASPDSVAAEARAFFEGAMAALSRITGDPTRATQILATLEGAMILAQSIEDIAVFDAATRGLRD